MTETAPMAAPLRARSEPPAHEPELAFERAARAILGNPGKTMLYALTGAGLIEAVKLGRRTAWRVASLRAYAASLPPARIGAGRRAAP